MLMVYLNSPNSRISAHRSPNCSRIQVMQKPNQRHCRIDATSISTELAKFANKQYRFQSTADLNDLWLEIDFGDEDFERAVLSYVLRLLGRHYSFAKGRVRPHC